MTDGAPHHGSFDSTVLAHNPDAVVVLDPAGIVRHWNTAAETIFGYGVAEALGRPLAELIVPENEQEEFRRALREAGLGACAKSLWRRTGFCREEAPSARCRCDGARLTPAGGLIRRSTPGS